MSNIIKLIDKEDKELISFPLVESNIESDISFSFVVPDEHIFDGYINERLLSIYEVLTEEMDKKIEEKKKIEKEIEDIDAKLNGIALIYRDGDSFREVKDLSFEYIELRDGPHNHQKEADKYNNKLKKR